MALGLAARPARRRDARPGDGVAVPRAPRRGVRLLPRRASARQAGVRAGQGSRRRRRARAARPARRAAPPLDRRLDVLELRLDRRRGRRQPVCRPAVRVPAEPRRAVHGRRLAGYDHGVRAGLHRALGTGRRAGGHLVRRGCVALQEPGRRRRARGLRRGGACERDGRRSPWPSSAGTPCSPSTRRAVGTTTRSSEASSALAVALALRRRHDLSGALWVVAVLVKWVPARLSRALGGGRERPVPSSRLARHRRRCRSAGRALDLALRDRLAPGREAPRGERRPGDELRAPVPSRIARRAARRRSRPRARRPGGGAGAADPRGGARTTRDSDSRRASSS